MKRIMAIPLLLAGIAGTGERAIAHGANIDYTRTEAIKIHAQYESGEPMANSSVTVYAPDDPAQPWLQGETDDNGNFVFVPDFEQAGDWAVRVRQAGHGNILNISIEDGARPRGSAASSDTISGSTGNYNPIRRWVAIFAVVWGFVGTALFFARSKRSTPAETEI